MKMTETLVQLTLHSGDG